MIGFIKKLKTYGFKRACVLIGVKFFNSFKVFMYKLLFSDNNPEMYSVRINLPTQFMGKGKIKLNGCQLGVWPSPYFLGGSGYMEARSESASIEVGKDTVLNNNYVVIADRSIIKIGNRCLIGPNFFVSDSDFHGLGLQDRNTKNYATSSVVIGDDVFIGDNVRILKGVIVGDGVIIGSGSVVVNDVSEGSIVAGVPAKFIRKC